MNVHAVRGAGVVKQF